MIFLWCFYYGITISRKTFIAFSIARFVALDCLSNFSLALINLSVIVSKRHRYRNGSLVYLILLLNALVLFLILIPLFFHKSLIIFTPNSILHRIYFKTFVSFHIFPFFTMICFRYAYSIFSGPFSLQTQKIPPLFFLNH